MLYPDKLLESFYARIVVAENGCWIWDGYVNAGGYGTISWQKRPRRTHRFSWEVHKGAIPEELYVLHRCDNRRCCNPEHLFLGTQKDNMQDMIAKGRQNLARRKRS